MLKGNGEQSGGSYDPYGVFQVPDEDSAYELTQTITRAYDVR
ncbi:hypothetical protein [Streptomyces sp. JH14]|nr:hypothetical protein [Streptomyces sp. JH14]